MIIQLVRIFTSVFFSDDLSITDKSDTLGFQQIFPENMKLEILKMCLSLFLLLSFFVLLVLAYKKYLKSRGHHFNRSITIKILDKRSISPKTCIYLLRVINKIVIISESGEHVTLLGEFPPNTDINQLCSEHISDTCKQSDTLDKLMKKFQKTSSS